ncbi:unnamed protein product [Musa textilis]
MRPRGGWWGKKKAKGLSQKSFEGVTLCEAAPWVACKSGSSSHGEGSSAKGKGRAGSPGDNPLGGWLERPKSMRDLCRVRASNKGEPFQALSIADLLEGESSMPYESRSTQLWRSRCTARPPWC